MVERDYEPISVHAYSRLEFEDELDSDKDSPVPKWDFRSDSSNNLTNRFIQIWLHISPFITIGLFLLVFKFYTSNPHPLPIRIPATLGETLDLYACESKSAFSSLTQICEKETEQDIESYKTGGVEKYELGQDRHLTQNQCDIIFPGLYSEVDRAIEYWKARGGVTLQDLDEAEVESQARVLIINNRMYVKSWAEHQPGTRAKAILGSIRDALIGSLESLPDVEFVIQTGDNGIPKGAAWALGRRATEPSLTLMPDFGFFSWPEPGVGGMVEVADKCQMFEQGLLWKDKIPQLIWKGALMVEIRKELVEIANRFKWGAVSGLDWGDRDHISQSLNTPEQHCGYKYLAHVEGVAYSGRGKQLLQCRSVVITHDLIYIQHFHHLFNSNLTSPDQNIVVSPGRNFDELPTTMEWLMKHDDRAERIADNCYKFFRHYLSPASVDCYWRRLMQKWSEVLMFKPELPSDVASYESFILLGKTHWIPYK